MKYFWFQCFIIQCLHKSECRNNQVSCPYQLLSIPWLILHNLIILHKHQSRVDVDRKRGSVLQVHFKPWRADIAGVLESLVDLNQLIMQGYVIAKLIFPMLILLLSCYQKHVFQLTGTHSLLEIFHNFCCSAMLFGGQQRLQSF